MEKQQKNKRLTAGSILIGILYLIGQHCMYLLGHELSLLIGGTPYLPKLPLIDDAIPLLSVFIIPYVWSYAYWAMGPMAVSRCDDDHYRDFLASILLALLVGVLMLGFCPTYMDRNAEGLYLQHGNSIFEKLRIFWYSLDGDAIAYNLLPSFHCINSTLCYLGVRGRKELPKWFRIYSLITTLLIYASTVCVKQHYFADVISGIIVALVAYFLCKRYHWGRFFLCFKRKNNKLTQIVQRSGRLPDGLPASFLSELCTSPGPGGNCLVFRHKSTRQSNKQTQ